MSQKSRASRNNENKENQKTPSPKGNNPKEENTEEKTPSDEDDERKSQDGQQNNTASRSELHSRKTASGNISRQQTIHENCSKNASRHPSASMQSGANLHSRESQRVGRASAQPSNKSETRERATINESRRTTPKSKGSCSLVSGPGEGGSVDKLSTKHPDSIRDSVTAESVLNYSLLDFRAVDYDSDVANARVVIHSSPDVCTCYPQRSSQAIPSMIYDKVKCVHHGLVGYIHDGVCDFDEGWRGAPHQDIRKQSLQRENTSFFRGYPQPLLERMIESQRSSMVSEEELKRLQSGNSFTERQSRDIAHEQVSVKDGESNPISKSLSGNNSQKSKSKQETPLTSNQASGKGSSRKPSVNRDEPKERPGIDLTSSQKWNMKLPSTPEKRPTSAEILGLDLPKIGYSPPPKPKASLKSSFAESMIQKDNGNSNNGSRLSFEDKNPVTLFTPSSGGQPEKPGSFTDSKTPMKTINKNRTFQGRYYDPVKDEVIEYEVTHEFGKHINRWSTKQVHTTQ